MVNDAAYMTPDTHEQQMSLASNTVKICGFLLYQVVKKHAFVYVWPSAILLCSFAVVELSFSQTTFKVKETQSVVNINIAASKPAEMSYNVTVDTVEGTARG